MFTGVIRDSEAFKLQRSSSSDRDHLSAGRRCRGSNDIMVMIMIMIKMMMMLMRMMVRIKVVMMMMLLVMMMTPAMEKMLLMMSSKNQVVHHDASDKLFGYNTSSSAWQVNKLPLLQTICTATSEIYNIYYICSNGVSPAARQVVIYSDILRKHCKNAKLPWHHNMTLSFRFHISVFLSFRPFVFLSFYLIVFYDLEKIWKTRKNGKK